MAIRLPFLEWEKQDNFDIYIKLIGSQDCVRLTTDRADDVSPAFSPDGRSIGFLRISNGHASFIVIPAIGGPECIVGQLPDVASDYLGFGWLPDSKWIVTNGLGLLSVESGETRSLTSSAAKSRIDFSPAISPDGRNVAFNRGTSLFTAQIYLLHLTAELKLVGEPRRLSSLRTGFGSAPVWTPDGKELIFSGGTIGATFLWRVPVSGDREPEQLAFIGEETDQHFLPPEVCGCYIWSRAISSGHSI
jgi:Tol biopolymer transport system component